MQYYTLEWSIPLSSSILWESTGNKMHEVLVKLRYPSDSRRISYEETVFKRVLGVLTGIGNYKLFELLKNVTFCEGIVYEIDEIKYDLMTVEFY